MEINLKADDISMVIGQRGTGKSVLADYLLQEYSLYLDLSVWENIVFFGKLYGLSKKKN